MEPKQCQTCIWWRRVDEWSGACHHNPPTESYQFPMTRIRDFCSRYDTEYTLEDVLRILNKEKPNARTSETPDPESDDARTPSC